jgi:hypothetical protein
MLETAYAIALIGAVANFALKFPFVDALRREAAEVFASFLVPSPPPFGWRARAMGRYYRLIVLREYRSRLASCPAAKAWASWLFLVHWLQLMAVVMAILAVASR